MQSEKSSKETACLNVSYQNRYYIFIDPKRFKHGKPYNLLIES